MAGGADVDLLAMICGVTRPSVGGALASGLPDLAPRLVCAGDGGRDGAHLARGCLPCPVGGADSASRKVGGGAFRTGMALYGTFNTSEAVSAMETNVGASTTLVVACPGVVAVDVPICEMESSGTTSSAAPWVCRRITVASETSDGGAVHCGTGGGPNATDRCRPWLRARSSLRRDRRGRRSLASCSARNLANSSNMELSGARYGSIAKMSCSTRAI